MSTVLLESRPYRPFKSSDEYLVAMKEDLAEWLQTMYPHLNINVENFFEKLETGVALCEHANAVKLQAIEYVEKKQAKKVMSKSVTGSLADALRTVNIQDVKYFSTAKPGTFFARDNVSNFIKWCRHSIEIIECLLFETDDLILRKNEKHFILCLLEVARRGAKYGMLAPMLIQMERQIDREIAADNKKMNGTCDENEYQNGLDDDSELDSDFETEETPLIYGPVPQIITNDLKSLDEMVRDLVAQCTCPTQFPMIRVSEGKYRIGDTKVLIFVRILRNHVMVRVGGGWDTLSHYLDKHDPCRCRSQHRSTQGARLVNKPGAADLHGSHVHYERSTVPQAQVNGHVPNGVSSGNSLGPPMNSLNRSRSRSPSHVYHDRRSVSPNFPRKSLAPPSNRSRSPTPNFTSTHITKLSTRGSPQHKNYGHNSGPQSLPIMSNISPKSKHISHISIPLEAKPTLKTEAVLHVNDTDTQSDTTSEMSDEGYRSLGIIQDKNRHRVSVNSQNSVEDVEENEHQQVYTDDDLNDMGLRKTNYSHIYEHGDPKSVKIDKENTPEEPQLTVTSKIQSKTKSKERSFVKANSTERNTDLQKSPKPPHYKKTNNSINSTWNGRSKASRPSITSDTYTPNLARNAMSRRSVSFDRRPNSANTSPTKGNLRKELIEAVKQTKDEAAILLQVQEVLKKYGSLSHLCLDDEDIPPKMDRTKERMSYRSPRKDSRPENISRIPAPLGFKQV